MSKEKYGITDAHYLCDSAIFNTETDEVLRLYQICDLLNQQNQRICDLLNQQNQRIAELEEQLKNKQDELDFSININRNKKRNNKAV